MTYLLVSLGAAVGAILRYDGTKLIKKHWQTTFPWATLAINVLGALLLGLVAATYTTAGSGYALLGTGLCGGFTTFSTMSFETAKLLQNKRWGLAISYLLISTVAGLAAVALGLTWAG